MKIFSSIIFLLLIGQIVFCNTYYLDPQNGSLNNDGSFSSPWTSLSEIIDANYIQSREYTSLPYTNNNPLIDKNINGFVRAGDTLVLREGLHGSIFLRNYINESPITIIGYQDEKAIIENVHLQACKNWVFEELDISSEPYGYFIQGRLFYVETHGWQGPSSHVIIKNCDIYSSNQPWTTSQEWLDYASDGIYIQADSCIARNNKIFNVDMGLSCVGNYITATDNSIVNFSGDGGRILGSNIVFNYNLIKNNYKVDDNHDDGIQSFTTNGFIVDNNEVIGNFIINSDDENQALAGPLQGIACFDGFYNDWIIANNVVSVNHWHGISLYGAKRCTIIHNTVIDPTPNITPGGSWIRIDDNKDGTPSSDCVVANNVANKFVVDALDINNRVLDTQSAYSQNFKNYPNFEFDLLQSSNLIDNADKLYSIPFDINQSTRDSLPDIGAIEYSAMTNTIINQNLNSDILIYPNPFNSILHISNLSINDKIICYDLQGNELCSGNLEFVNERLNSLTSGIYVIVILDPEKNVIKSSRVYKF